MIRVLLADDHPIVRSGFRRLLEQAGGIRVVAEAADADSAFTAFVDHAPDVLLSDLTMPGGGLNLLARALAASPHARVGVFSMHDDAVTVRRVLQAGAAAFISKSSPPPYLIAAVRALHEGRRYLSPDLSPDLLQSGEDAEAARIASLSPREHQVFVLLAQGRSLQDCALNLGVSAKTAANLQAEVKHKLGVPTSAALAHLALRHAHIAQLLKP